MPLPHPALILDASAGSVFVGVTAPNGSWAAHQQGKANVLEGLFPSVHSCLEQAGLEVDSIRSFVYSEGPGSVLGLRLCAMAIETWRSSAATGAKLYRYNTLHLCSALITRDHPDISEAMLISDWKKGVWHSLVIDHTRNNEVQAIEQNELGDLAVPLFHLPQRKGWQSPPDGVIEVAYQPERLVDVWDMQGILSETDSVELFSAGSNTFQKWTPERHRLAK